MVNRFSISNDQGTQKQVTDPPTFSLSEYVSPNIRSASGHILTENAIELYSQLLLHLHFYLTIVSRHNQYVSFLRLILKDPVSHQPQHSAAWTGLSASAVLRHRRDRSPSPPELPERCHPLPAESPVSPYGL